MRNLVLDKITVVFALLIAFSTTIVSVQKTGKASFYSSCLQGRHTSDGGEYHTDSLTCAHLNYPFGTLLQVSNPKNNKVVIVKVTDCGPHTRKRMIDLSYSTATEFDIIIDEIAIVAIIKIDYLTLLPNILPLPVTQVFITISSIFLKAEFHKFTCCNTNNLFFLQR